MSTVGSLGGSSSGTLNFTGLASGIDTNQIIQGLLQIQQQQVTNLQAQQKAVTGQETTFKGIEAKLLTLQGTAAALARAVGGVFDASSVTSSDQNAVTGAASSGAAPGVYSFRVGSLAQAAVIASQGFDGPGSTVTTGTFGFQVGSGPVTSVTIDGTNNTLQGLADAINAANAGVTASVINDGSGPRSQPYRLVLTAGQTGAANAVTVTSNLGADAGGATRPVFGATDFGAAVAGAANTGTSAATADVGAGNYTGTGNNTYTFTVASGGTVGTDPIVLNYADATGTHTGQVTLAAGYTPGTPQAAAQGLTVAFGAGTLAAGDTFTVKAYDPNVQKAADATLTVGSGAGALAVSSPTNQVDGVIPGVTLNLLQANPNENVTLTVAADTSAITKAVQDFVGAYNDAVGAIAGATSFDPSTNTAGVLLGNADVNNIQGRLAAALGSAVPGVNARLNNLTALGITTNADGTLALDSGKLAQVLGGQVPGVSLSDVRNLFTLSGSADNGAVQFIFGTDQTQASANPYQVVVTQAATRGSITGAAVVAAPVTVDGTNNTFTISVDGRAAQTVTIPPGTYTPLQLSQVIQAQINALTGLSGSVQVNLAGGQLTIASPTYGSASGVSVGGGTALGVLGFTAGQSGAGQDVAGHFVVGGVSEAATGRGQFLTGDGGNAHTDGLEVRVSLTPAQVQANPQVNLTVSRGVASGLGLTLNRLLDPVNGQLQSIDQGYQDRIAGIQKTIDNDNNLITQRQNALVAQFAALEAAISKLKTEQQAITAAFGTSSSGLNSLSQTGQTSGSPSQTTLA